MNTFTTILGWVFLSGIVLLAAMFVTLGNDEGALIASASCALAFVLLNLGTLKTLAFSFGPLKAQMERELERAKAAADEAIATVEQLRSLAVTLTRPMLGSVMEAGRFAGDKERRGRFEVRDAVVEELRAIGASAEQIARATSAFDRWVELDHCFDVQMAAVVGHPYPDPLIQQVAGCLHGVTEHAPTVIEPSAVFRTCLAGFMLIHDELDATLRDLEHFQRTRELRRPEVFFSRG